MAEGFNDENPVTRGRRDPEITALLEAENEMAAPDENHEADQAYVGLFPGDPVILKVTLFAKTPLGDAWFTAGTQSRVADGETSEMSFNRISDVITEEVMRFGQKQIEAIEYIQEELPTETPQTQRRITPR